MLADMIRADSHQLRPEAGAVKVVARTHKTLIWERTRAVQRLRHQLREYFPAALEAFGRTWTLRTPWSCWAGPGASPVRRS